MGPAKSWTSPRAKRWVRAEVHLRPHCLPGCKKSEVAVLIPSLTKNKGVPRSIGTLCVWRVWGWGRGKVAERRGEE